MPNLPIQFNPARVLLHAKSSTAGWEEQQGVAVQELQDEDRTPRAAFFLLLFIFFSCVQELSRISRSILWIGLTGNYTYDWTLYMFIALTVCLKQMSARFLEHTQVST